MIKLSRVRFQNFKDASLCQPKGSLLIKSQTNKSLQIKLVCCIKCCLWYPQLNFDQNNLMTCCFCLNTTPPQSKQPQKATNAKLKCSNFIPAWNKNFDLSPKSYVSFLLCASETQTAVPLYILPSVPLSVTIILTDRVNKEFSETDLRLNMNTFSCPVWGEASF